MNRPPDPVVAVCAGKDCAKDRRTSFRALVAALDDTVVVKTKCLGVCHGPVAVIDPGSAAPIVVERIRKPKQARAVRRLARRGGEVPSRLRLVAKPKRRAKALARVAKAIDATSSP